MKRRFFLRLMALSLVCLFNGCSDEENEGAKDAFVGTWTVDRRNAVGLEWEAKEGTKISLGDLGSVSVSMVSQLAPSLLDGMVGKLQEVTFTSGNQIDLTLNRDGQSVKLQGYAKYKAVNFNKMLVYVDVDKALAGEDIDAVTLAAIKVAAKSGIPLHCTLSEDGSTGIFYLDTETMKGLKPILPLLASSIKADSAEETAQIKAVINSFSEALDNTTKIELSLRMGKR